LAAGELAVIAVFEEHPKEFLAHAKSMGPDLETMAHKGLLEAIYLRPLDLSVDEALLEIQGSRIGARLDEHGAPVLLEAQDRTRWNQMLIRRGLAALQQAQGLAARGKPVGKYFIQASIAAQHARAGRADDTDWRQIAMLYDVLAQTAPGPIVEVNRAVAHGRAFDPGAGLAVLEELEADQLGDSPLVPSVRGDLLERAGRHADAADAFTEAAARTRNEAERAVLQRRADENLTRVSKSG